MRKSIWIVLVVVARNAFAGDWTPVSSDDYMATYVDMESVRKTGNTSKIWVMYDYRKIQNFTDSINYQSAGVQQEYDCENERSRILSYVFYSGQLRSGNVTYSYQKNGDWRPLVPDSVSHSVYRIACSDRK